MTAFSNIFIFYFISIHSLAYVMRFEHELFTFHLFSKWNCFESKSERQFKRMNSSIKKKKKSEGRRYTFTKDLNENRFSKKNIFNILHRHSSGALVAISVLNGCRWICFRQIYTWNIFQLKFIFTLNLNTIKPHPRTQ